MTLQRRPPFILVIEDDPEMQSFYRGFFEKHAEEFSWRSASNERRALDLLAHHPEERVSVVLLSQGLAGYAGLDVLRRLKSDPLTNEIPVFLVSAKRSMRDQVAGLEAGAEEYLVRPFDAAQLWARLRVTLRRMGLADGGETLEIDGLRLDGRARTLTIGKKLVHLEPKEFEILRILLRRPNILHTAEALLNAVWGHDADAYHHVLYSKISNIRRKLGPKWAARLRSHRGQGYKLELPTRRRDAR